MTLCSRSLNEIHLRLNENKIGYCCKMKMPAENTDQHTRVFNDLFTGLKPSECTVCWNAEESSMESWRQIGNRNYDAAIIKIEVTLDNTCDLACAYCYGNLSSVWQSAIRTAPEKFRSNLQALGCSADNVSEQTAETLIYDSLIRAATADNINVVEVALLGGEPFLSPFFKKNKLFELINTFFDKITSKKKLNISIITNGNTPKKLLEKYISQLELLQSNYPYTLNFNIMISNESVGSTSDYIRFGSNWNLFSDNVNRWLSSKIKNIGFLATVNSLSIIKTKDFINFAHKTFLKHNRKFQVSLSTVYDPVEFSLSILDSTFLKYLNKANKYCQKNSLQISQYGHSFEDLKGYIGKNISQKEKLKTTFEYYKEIRKVNFLDIEPVIYKYIMENNNEYNTRKLLR